MVSPFPVRPSGPERRYSARYLLLVYENTPQHFDPLEIRRLARLEQARCTIIREQPVDGLCNYLAFIDFAGKRFQTRNERLFDIQGYHPKWCPLSSSPATYYDQCLKRGHIVLSEAPRPRDRSVKKLVTKLADWEELTVSNNRDDFFDTCKEQAPAQLAPQLDHIRARLEQRAQIPVAGVNSDVSRLTSSWTDGFKAGFEAGMSLGSSAVSASRASAAHNVAELSTEEVPAEALLPNHSLDTLVWHKEHNYSGLDLQSLSIETMGGCAQLDHTDWYGSLENFQG